MTGLFVDGKVGAVISGPWNIGEFSEALGDKLAVAPLPTIDGENLASYSTVKGWLVSEYSEHVDWATELALFLTNEENSFTYFEHTEEPPARVDVEIKHELQAGFMEQIEFAVPMPNIPAMSAVWEPMEDAFVFISEGDDVQEVLEEAVGQINENIEIMGTSE